MSLRVRVSLICSVFCFAVFFGAAPPAAAQDLPALEVTLGYSLLRVQRGLGVDLTDVKQTLHGWYVEGATNETNLLSLVGQGTGNYTESEGQDVSVYEFAAGPRFNHRTPARTLFGQFLVGVSHYRPYGEDRATNATVHFGGGLRLGPTTGLGVRISADYEIILTEGSHLLQPETGERTHSFRVNVGVVLPIGG